MFWIFRIAPVLSPIEGARIRVEGGERERERKSSRVCVCVSCVVCRVSCVVEGEGGKVNEILIAEGDN